jgi:roadblock/LC7 domain-containing protein
MIVLLSVSSLWAQQIGGTLGAAGIRGRLPVRVAGRVFFVVPVTELPSDLQARLKGNVAFAVVDEQGRIPKDKEVIFKALVAHHVARVLLDGPKPGWDVSKADSEAGVFEYAANVIRDILIRQGVADLLSEAASVGARWLVIGGLAGAGTPLPLYAPRDAVEAVVGQLLGNPKNAARLLISLDLARAERKLREGAQVLRSVQGYPLDSEVASKLNDILMLDWPLGNAAASARLAIAGSVPDQLVEPVKAALKEFLSLLREASDPNVSFAGEYGTVALKFFGLVRQVEGWNAYEHERRRIIDSWKRHLDTDREMAEALYSAAQQSESSEWRTSPQGAFRPKLLWQRKFKDFPVWAVAISPDGRLLAVAGGSEYLIDKEGGVHLVRTTDGALLKFLSLGEGNYASDVAFSPDGKLLAVKIGGGGASLWRVDNGSLLQKKGSYENLLSFLGIARPNFSPDGKLVAEVEDVVIEDAPDCGGLVKVQHKMVVQWVEDGRVAWDFATGFECESPDAPPSSRSAAVFSPDGSLLALAGWDGIIRIWSVKDRELVGTLKMPGVYSLAFSKDGKLLAAGALMEEVKLWRVKEE